MYRIIKYFDFTILVLASGLLLFFSEYRLISISIFILTLTRFFFSTREKESYLIRGLLLANIFLSLFLFNTSNHLLFLKFSCVFILISSLLVLFKVRNFANTIGLFFNIFSLFFIIISLAFAFFTIYPRQLVNLAPHFFPTTLEEERKTYVSKEGYLMHKNYTYPSLYKNNKLDVYQAKNSKATIFFVHGGGYSVYDKEHRSDYLIRFVEEGYTVVNINYSLFPENAYPDTIKQVIEAYSYIIDKAEEFGIDKNKIVLSGDSAGGQLAGQLALLLTNEKYAQNMKIEINSPTKPLAFVGVATMLDPSTANQTNFAPINWLFDTVLRDYFATDNLSTSEKTKEASIIHNINTDFSASFISDGNLASFDYQAKEFDKKLKSFGVESELYLIDTSNILQHGFELDVDNLYAQDVFEKQIEFMDKQVKKT